MKRQRRCKCRIGWIAAVLLMGLLALVLTVAWRLSTPTFVVNLHDGMEARMLAWDGWHADAGSIPDWVGHLIEIQKTPRTLQRWMKESDRRDWTSDSLLITWAIACHRISQFEDRERWLHEGRKALARISAPGDRNAYYTSARKALDGTALSQAERSQFENLLQRYPKNWFVAHLARVHGFGEGADGPSFVQRRDAILGGMVIGSLGYIFVMLLTLPCGWMGWRTVRKLPGASTAASRRLSRRWPVPTVLGIWSLLLTLSLIGGFFIALAGGILIPKMVRPADSYWCVAWFSFLTEIIIAAFAPVAMKWRLTHGRGILRSAFGFEKSDFFNGRVLCVGVTTSVALVGSTASVEALFDLFGHPLLHIDQFTRGLRYLGDAAVAAMFVYGCLLAPLCEEIVFRGFIFTSMKARWGPVVAAFASTSIFAAIHGYGWLGTIHVFVAGLLMCWVFHRTGRLATSIILHGSMNFLVLVLNHFSTGV